MAVTGHFFAYREKLPLPIWVLYRAFRVPTIASAFIAFWGGAVLLAWVVLPLTALGSRNARTRALRCQAVVAWMFRLFHGYMRVLRLFEARVSPMPETPGPTRTRGRVIVANHTTLVDVSAICSVYPNICCIVHGALARNPFLAPLFRLCGFVSAGRETRERVEALDRACAWIDRGFDVLIFPEGTRSVPGSLHRFHRGAFELARRAGVDIVPLVLRCEPSALSKGRPFWAQPDTCAVLTVEPRAPIHVDSETNSRTLRAEVEASYRTWLGV